MNLTKLEGKGGFSQAPLGSKSGSFRKELQGFVSFGIAQNINVIFRLNEAMENACLCQESLLSVSVEILSGMRIIQHPHFIHMSKYSK